LAILFREPFRAGSELLHQRFAERGHPEIRPPHDNVMQFLDDDGTRVSVLAQRAQITKQSMAELVAHLERLGYVERVPDRTVDERSWFAPRQPYDNRWLT
jgi:DNA-binding MarR family transcriptional regulator